MPEKPMTLRDGEVSDGSPSVQALNEIFTEVTGVERFIETQEQSNSSTRLMEDNDPGDYVASMVKTTGLSETLAEPKTEATEE